MSSYIYDIHVLLICSNFADPWAAATEGPRRCHYAYYAIPCLSDYLHFDMRSLRLNQSSSNLSALLLHLHHLTHGPRSFICMLKTQEPTVLLLHQAFHKVNLGDIEGLTLREAFSGTFDVKELVYALGGGSGYWHGRGF